MPVLGLGLWQAASGREAQTAVMRALETGYRLFDTAKLYGNERDVGIAVRKSGIPREEVFVTTKLWNSDHGYAAAKRAFEESRNALDLGYVDLYLIHWPVPGLRQESWGALVELSEEGRCRSIGVSNYTIRHLDEMVASPGVVPSVNQVEFHPFLYQKELLKVCRDRGIQLEAYSPLTKGRRLHDLALVEVAREYDRTPAQVLIRWSLQRGLVVIPKSVRPERIRQNADVFDFELRPEDLARLDALDQQAHVAWNPDDLT